MTRTPLLFVLLACSKGNAPVATGSAEAPKPAVAIDAAVADLPPPWREIPPPTEEQLLCANHGETWAVSAERGAVAVDNQKILEPDSGPALPFKPAAGVLADGQRHTIEVSDGFLVGIFGGEWGGSLDWFSRDGKKHASLGKPNVRGISPLGDDEVIVLSGLNHLGLEEGAAQWLARDAQGWHATASAKLDGEPETFVDAGDALYTVTPHSLVRIGRDRKVEILAALQTTYLYPESMAVDAQRRLWIGMRGFVVKVARNGTITWFATAPPCAPAPPSTP